MAGFFAKVAGKRVIGEKHTVVGVSKLITSEPGSFDISS
jgi:hypothetical protein